MKPERVMPMEMPAKLLHSQEPVAIAIKAPPAHREARSSEQTALFHCTTENKTCRSMEVSTREMPQQEPTAISIDPPAHKAAQSSEPLPLHCSMEKKTY